ncbi:hypothetical protein PoB_001771000 [Plakobranchus ocellatus]|uniref:Uncharacterized protein n=1 Tax=Plakobranchus ocellatus TaxID=259542 RepID=A0AAV3Z6T7_9GAST|nr:hypothetical protein PoB_001771000 [Plakobranchus ocellatus]
MSQPVASRDVGEFTECTPDWTGSRLGNFHRPKFRIKTRSRGRQREKTMDGLATWLGPGNVSDILAAVKDRDLWRDMIANVYKQGT